MAARFARSLPGISCAAVAARKLASMCGRAPARGNEINSLCCFYAAQYLAEY
jgi:hypothetical protein